MRPIEDHAAIGDGRSVALVSRDGAIEWLCWPRVDSSSLFAALLDEERGGRWRVAAADSRQTHQRYVPSTNVLETAFETGTGGLTVVDSFPLATEDVRRRELVPEHELLRLATCTHGEVELVSRLDARPDYARSRARWRASGTTLRARIGRSELLFLGETAHAILPDGSLEARTRLRAGESIALSLSWSGEGPAVLPPLGDAARERLRRTIAWWREWAAAEVPGGRWSEAVRRAKLVLKLLVYAPSGAILAAPTTSLPEQEGGALNWDYRYCWLRDASFTMRALLLTGSSDEGRAFVDWLFHSTRRTLPRLSPLYDVFGCRAPRERVLPHLRGWRGSSPVRIGNGARSQLQLDVQGEVVDAAARLARGGFPLDGLTSRLLVTLGKYVAGHWREPDSGLWEPRTEPEPHTSSRLMCWVALDRLVRLHEDGMLHARAPIARFARERDAIREAIETHSFDPHLGCYVETPGRVDAALLRLAILGFEDARTARMQRTFDVIERTLRVGEGLYLRYLPARGEHEGAFALCAFWAAEFLALSGRVDEARATLDAAAGFANHVGLLAEEYDPLTGEARGNFPQAFSHVGLVNAATAVERAERARCEAPPSRHAEQPEEGHP